MTTTGQSAVDLAQIYDVLVIGGGNAALCAAMTARESGATVLLLEVESPNDSNRQLKPSSIHPERL